MKSVLYCMLGALALASSALGDTAFVAADGSGDYPTIAAAVAALPGGSTILLGDGVFSGDGNCGIYLAKSLWIRSESGNAGACIIDGGGSHYGFYLDDYPNKLMLYDVTIRNASAFGGGALYAGSGAQWAIVHGCRFIDNHASESGGAVYVAGLERFECVNCEFDGNSASHAGTSIFSIDSPATLWQCSITGGGNEDSIYPAVSVDCQTLPCDVRDCTFTDLAGLALGVSGSCEVRGSTFRSCGAAINLVGTFVAAAVVQDCSFLDCTRYDTVRIGAGGATAVAVRGCLFARNVVDSVYPWRAALQVSYDGIVSGCTFVDNDVDAAIVAWGSDGLRSVLGVERTLVVRSGDPILCMGGLQAFAYCCDFQGRWTGCVGGQLGGDGNIDADPLFCSPGAGDYHLSSLSPCSPDQSGCGLIGALEVACDVSGVEARSLSAIKALY